MSGKSQKKINLDLTIKALHIDLPDLTPSTIVWQRGNNPY